MASEIAKRGGIVHMVCRNETTANEAKTEIVEDTKNEVHIHYSHQIIIIHDLISTEHYDTQTRSL